MSCLDGIGRDIVMLMKCELKPFSILLLSTALLLGCGGESPEGEIETDTGMATTRVPPPTETEAAEIIQKAPQYSDFRFTSVTLSLPMKQEMMHDEMKSYAQDLERAGWLRIDGTGTVVLADKARRDNRWVERPNGFTDIAPLARKEFVEVTSVEQGDADTVSANFTYRWVQNPTGAAIQSGALREVLDSEHFATATLKDYGDGWELYIIRAAEPPEESSTESTGADGE